MIPHRIASPALALVLCLAGLAGTWLHGARYGAAQVRAEWDAARATHAEQIARTLNDARAKEAAHARRLQQARTQAAAATAEAASAARAAGDELDRLRRAAADGDREPGAEDRAASGGSDADPRAARELLVACASHLVSVAADADRLSLSLGLLQSWATATHAACGDADAQAQDTQAQDTQAATSAGAELVRPEPQPLR